MLLSNTDTWPPPDIIDDVPEYEVEEIRGKRKFRRRIEYLVKWKGYPHEESTWIPIHNLPNAMELVAEYEQKLLNQPFQ